MTFKYVEIFAGIGGFRQALDNLGGHCELASELDEFAKRAYRALYDGAPELQGDVTKIEASDVPDHDLLVGGFPCQAFSVAGKRLGFEDTRGTLFFEVARIAKEKRPKAILLENVKGLVSHDKGRTLDTIVQTLNDIGYTVDFEVLNSKYFGVPQNRERIFIVAIRDDLIEPAPWVTGKRTDVVAKGKRRIGAIEGVKTFNFDYPSQNEVTTRLRDILEESVDERYYLSEEKTAKLVAQLEERTEGIAIKEATTKGFAIANEGDAVNFQFPDNKTRRGRVGKQIAQTLEASGINQGVVEEMDKQRELSENDVDPLELDASEMYRDEEGTVYYFDGVRDDGLWTMLKAEDTDVIVNIDPNELVEIKPHLAQRDPVMVGHVDLKGHDAIKRVYSAEGVSPTLTTMGGGHREPKIVVDGFNTLADGTAYALTTRTASCYLPRHVEKKQATLVEEVRAVLTPEREEKRQQGRRFKNNDEPAFTVTAQDRHGVAVSVESVSALTERRSEEAKEIRKEYREKYGKDFSPRRGKVVVPREDEVANCVTATQTIEQKLLEKPRYRIRKLTPLECFRLQGFSDESHQALVDAGISNSQRYKMAGNAVTVNVISAIGKRLLSYLDEKTE